LTGIETDGIIAAEPRASQAKPVGVFIMPDKEDKAWLLGLGLDCRDGHRRFTRGENFLLFGGSQETHEVMQEKSVKFNEKLKERGKTLEELSRGEFVDIAQDIGMAD
jgi:hypothetical protein